MASRASQTSLEDGPEAGSDRQKLQIDAEDEDKSRPRPRSQCCLRLRHCSSRHRRPPYMLLSCRQLLRLEQPVQSGVVGVRC